MMDLNFTFSGRTYSVVDFYFHRKRRDCFGNVCFVVSMAIVMFFIIGCGPGAYKRPYIDPEAAYTRCRIFCEESEDISNPNDCIKGCITVFRNIEDSLNQYTSSELIWSIVDDAAIRQCFEASDEALKKGILEYRQILNWDMEAGMIECYRCMTKACLKDGKMK